MAEREYLGPSVSLNVRVPRALAQAVHEAARAAGEPVYVWMLDAVVVALRAVMGTTEAAAVRDHPPVTALRPKATALRAARRQA